MDYNNSPWTIGQETRQTVVGGADLLCTVDRAGVGLVGGDVREVDDLLSHAPLYALRGDGGEGVRHVHVHATCAVHGKATCRHACLTCTP